MSGLSVFKKQKQSEREKERRGDTRDRAQVLDGDSPCYRGISHDQDYLLLVRKQSKFVRHVRRAGSDILSSLPPFSASLLLQS